MSFFKFFRISFVFVIALLFCKSNLHSQSSNHYSEVSIAAPTAAALGKYGDIPINYHTGVPGISIPLYTVKDGSLELPISLSYHASGLKVLEMASWVGAGWSLNAGGVITRTVLGGVDEVGTMTNQTHGHYSHYGYNSYLYTTPGGGGNGPPGTSPGNMDADDIGFSNGWKDGEPDLFFFNFNGYSGKFYFSDDRTPVFVPQQDFKVEVINPTNTTFTGFVLTTPDGTRYYFGQNQTPANGGVDAVETTSTFDAQNPAGTTYGTAYSSWYLTKIASADGVFSISLKYVSENYSHYTLSMFPLPSDQVDLQKEYHLIKNYIKGVRLSSISASNTTVSFVPAATSREDLSNFNPAMNTIQDLPSTDGKALESIQVSNGAAFCKKFKFTTSYFLDNITPVAFDGYNPVLSGLSSDKKRLRLDQVQELSCDETVSAQPYVFSYFAGLVPRQINFAQDHWGYYNGASNTRLIPTYYLDNGLVHTGANRDAKWPEMRAGTLQKVTYPTGGATTFDFEANTTWVSYSAKNWVFRFNTTVGYSGTGTSSTSEVFTANPYKVVLSNSACYGGVSQCGATIVVPGFLNDGCAGGTTIERLFTPTAGTYNVGMTKENPSGGYGASANFYEWTSSLYENNETVGGLRIKTVTTYDGVSTANNKVKNYTYNDGNGHSFGMLYSRPVYVGLIRNDALRDGGGLTGSIGVFLPNGSVCVEYWNGNPMGLCYQVSPSGIRPMETTQGNHIGYNEVKVSETGNGSSLYRYYGSLWDVNRSDVCVRSIKPSPPMDPNTPSYPYVPLPFEYQRGELKYEAHYNEAGQVLKDAIYTYTYADNVLVTPAIKYGQAIGWKLFTEYTLSTKRKTATQVVENIFGQGGGSMQTTNTTIFGSAYHSKPTSSTLVNSKGETLESRQKYASDYRVPACDALNDGLADYQSAWGAANYNFYANQNCTNTTSYNCLYLYYQQRRRDIAIARNNYITTRRNNFTNSVNAFKTAHDNAKTAADLNLKPILELQDQFQNPTIETSQWKNTSLLSANFNNYAFSTNPVTAIYPNKSQVINLAAPSTTFTSSLVSGNTITKDSRYTDEASLTFIKGLPVQIKPKGSAAISYLWGYSNQYPVAKVVNAKANEIYFESFEEPGGFDAYLTAYDNTKSHTGKYSGKIINSTGSEIVSRSTKPLTVLLTAPTKFKYSGWIYSTGPSVELYFFMRRQGETSYYTYLDYATTTVINKWVYLEKDFTVPADAVTLDVRVDNNGGGTVWYDDIRLHPSDAIMNTFTYDPLVGMTSECDQNKHVKYYEYDALQRLTLIRDQDQNILTRYCYNYAGQSTSCGTLITPPPIAITSTNSSGVTGFTAVYTNTVSGVVYSFPVTAAGGTLGTLPAGNYNITISKPGNSTNFTFNVCTTGGIIGTSATFSNISVAAGSCNNVQIAGPVSNVTITATNYAHLADFTALYTNTATGVQYSFTIPSTGGTLGTVPSGNYNITISKTDNTTALYFGVCSTGAVSGTSGSFSNITVSATACNVVTIDTLD